MTQHLVVIIYKKNIVLYIGVNQGLYRYLNELTYISPNLKT